MHAGKKILTALAGLTFAGLCAGQVVNPADKIAHRSRTRPIHVARTVHRALTVKRPRMRYIVGRPASIVIALRRYLPNQLFERLYFGALMRHVQREERPPRPLISSTHSTH